MKIKLSKIETFIKELEEMSDRLDDEMRAIQSLVRKDDSMLTKPIREKILRLSRDLYTISSFLEMTSKDALDLSYYTNETEEETMARETVTLKTL